MFGTVTDHSDGQKIVLYCGLNDGSSTAFKQNPMYTFPHLTLFPTPTNTKYKMQHIIWPVNLLKPTDHVMHQQFNIQQLYALPTLYLCVLYLSENKQRLVPLTCYVMW